MIGLLNALRDAGITLEVDEGSLAVTGANKAVNALLNDVKANKESLLEYKTKGVPTDMLMQLPLNTCLNCRRYYFRQNGCEIYSALAQASSACRCIWFRSND